MTAAVLVVGLAVLTCGCLVAAVVTSIRDRGDRPRGSMRCYPGVCLTPVGDRLLIVAGGVGAAAVAVCEPVRDGARPVPAGTTGDSADAAGTTGPARDDRHPAEPAWTDRLDAELADMLGAPLPVTADAEPEGVAVVPPAPLVRG